MIGMPDTKCLSRHTLSHNCAVCVAMDVKVCVDIVEALQPELADAPAVLSVM